MKNVGKENKLSKQDVMLQKKKIESLEREAKRKNIVAKGIMEIIGANIKEETDIDEARRMEKYRGKFNRPIIMKITTTIKKDEIINKAKELEGIGYMG
ncbi:hypothetical protein ILUMI_20010 [Ignelater luminosus]|uniref:Uncharacterized protein n=1 Tax=Ignelater luminosus TaxID=2038154 RepID=A0A8K0CF31_IGNLU|nr:hypothetical protein ILUMI_20010 [Ignelater luminosus]